MTFIRTAGLTLAIAAVSSLFLAEGWARSAAAATPSHGEAMAACRAKYGKKVTNAIVNKDGTLTCQWQVVRQMTRKEVYDACRKKFGATTAYVYKTKSGWLCRYRPKY